MAGDEPVMDMTAVGRLIGVRSRTVSQYLLESKPGGRYADHPFPAPDGRVAGRAYWLAKRAAEIRRWERTRKGQGAGGGRPRKSA